MLNISSLRSYAGTPAYSAPEQLNPSQFGNVDWRTDIWQLAVLLYEMITGNLPFFKERCWGDHVKYYYKGCLFPKLCARTNC